ncbi:MAG: MOSC N-terminal beta barrel domain-containing protein [Planctomycetota bacterium]
MPTIHRIIVFPIKSLDGHNVDASEVLTNGALRHDRRYALVDAWGKYVNGKTCPEIHRIRATFSDDFKRVSLACGQQPDSFEIATDQTRVADWCSEALGKKCRLIENEDGGFPDDSEAPGPTLVSTATLQAVADWYDGVDLAEARRRFRFNLEVEGVPAFWEDGLVAPPQQVRRFRVGEIAWQGNGVCKRCVVPTRNSLDGSQTAGFAREFVRQRELRLPDWAPRERFDTFYRLGVNTRIDSDALGAVIRVGDFVSLASSVAGES